MSKRKTPPEVGYRASEEFTRYARENGITFAQASERAGIERKASCEWWHGQSLSSASLVGLASIGIDVGYIITGKRTLKVVHAHWRRTSDRADTFICTNCDHGFDMWKHESYDFKYCPYCGAIMDEEDNK